MKRGAAQGVFKPMRKQTEIAPRKSKDKRKKHPDQLAASKRRAEKKRLKQMADDQKAWRKAKDDQEWADFLAFQSEPQEPDPWDRF